MITKNPMQLKAFIKKKAAEKNISAQLVMQNYMLERLLERISLSAYKRNFILKGGFLISAIVGLDTRATMDLDTTIKGFTKTQQKNFLQYIARSPMYSHWLPVMVTLLGTGLRVGECTGLTKDDVDLSKGQISVNHALIYRVIDKKADFHITTPKTESGTRVIPILYPEVVEQLRQQIEAKVCNRVVSDNVNSALSSISIPAFSRALRISS